MNRVLVLVLGVCGACAYFPVDESSHDSIDAGPMDRVAPEITSFTPSGGNVPPSSAIAIQFNEDVINVTNETFSVKVIDDLFSYSEEWLQGTVTYDRIDGARFVPTAGLTTGLEYRVFLDFDRITDRSGNPLVRLSPGSSLVMRFYGGSP